MEVSTKTYKYDNVNLKNHEAYGENATEKVDLENIYGELKGKSDSYILLCTHYDSAGAKEGRYSQSEGSLGSAGAGYVCTPFRYFPNGDSCVSCPGYLLPVRHIRK